MCWVCCWGVPKEIAEIYQEALTALGGCESSLHFGPSHAVWEDSNFDRETIEYCLAQCDKEEAWKHREDDTFADREVVKRSLQRLLELPPEVMDFIPENANDVDDYRTVPPREGLELVHI